MKKVNGSLGFTLRKAEEEDCGHIVRALVKEPAISDGRIKPGDQIISVSALRIYSRRLLLSFRFHFPTFEIHCAIK